MKKEISPEAAAYMAALARQSNKKQKKQYGKGYSEEMRRRILCRYSKAVDNAV